MPLYEYECDACNHRFEVIQKFSDPPGTCPKCGSTVQKLPSSPAIQFKGSGFYITDYARSGKSDSGQTESGKNDSGKNDSGASSSSTSESGPSDKDAKSAAKSESKSESKSETKTESKSDGKSDSKPSTPASS